MKCHNLWMNSKNYLHKWKEWAPWTQSRNRTVPSRIGQHGKKLYARKHGCSTENQGNQTNILRCRHRESFQKKVCALRIKVWQKNQRSEAKQKEQRWKEPKHQGNKIRPEFGGIASRSKRVSVCDLCGTEVIKHINVFQILNRLAVSYRLVEKNPSRQCNCNKNKIENNNNSSDVRHFQGVAPVRHCH